MSSTLLNLYLSYKKRFILNYLDKRKEKIDEILAEKEVGFFELVNIFKV
jgi:hypothetical protein